MKSLPYLSVMHKRLLSFFAWVLFININHTMVAQQQDNYEFADSLVNYYVPDVLQYADAVYKPNIKTVIFSPKGRQLLPPIIPLNGKDQLELIFDELDADEQFYSYTLVHCTWDWQPDALTPFEYINGFTRDDITNYRNSFNTFQPYVQYRLTLPNSSMQFTKSGNYLLKVYANDDPDDLILTRRFIVFENQLAIINPQVMTSGINNYFDTHHRINFSVSYPGSIVNNPMEEIYVTLMQNGAWNTAISGLKPLFIRKNELVYNYIDQTLFPAGNEYRFFDTRTLRVQTERVRNIAQNNNKLHVYITPDLPRSPQLETGKRTMRVNFVDMNGRFQIGVNDWGFTFLDADYAYVHFSLQLNEPITDGNVYVYGALTDWNLLPQFQLHYNYQNKAYEGMAYLKQGFYDYQYVIQRDGYTPPDASLTEGNFIMTENDYQILVYFRSFINRFDRLVGYSLINSRR